ncbi:MULTISPECIES: 50S ribosomal protein L4 [Halococcus]|uniref:Large ribosomal subunit protein uL4 n=1 Tax=Halococcus thailandensis JCM 13552 TaxID=1227457 RepID=M0N5I3_9EURY|nr:MULTISPECIES: 50S ribosomal protein L4 [Halococcus]EMA53126.1 50S ribosomal protein L4P [Halococcus thailandensis JCM 13552]
MTTVYDTDGTEAGDVELPDVFETPHRPELIGRAVRTAQANRAQPYGADDYAGMRTPAESFGSGRGMAHVPRSNGQGRRVPQTVGGRPAHPPKEENDRSIKLNDNERKLATRSAIAATADAERVSERGHEVAEFDGELPIVVDDEFEELVKTQDVVSLLESLGVHGDIERAEDRTVRAGRGTTRGRKYKRPTSILFVTSGEPSRAARNLAGADVATASEVNTEDLAPGTQSGRLTIWTESAIEEVEDR